MTLCNHALIFNNNADWPPWPWKESWVCLDL